MKQIMIHKAYSWDEPRQYYQEKKNLSCKTSEPEVDSQGFTLLSYAMIGEIVEVRCNSASMNFEVFSPVYQNSSYWHALEPRFFQSQKFLPLKF